MRGLHQQNVNDDEYTLKDSVTQTGTTDTNPDVILKDYEGFEPNVAETLGQFRSANLLVDTTTVAGDGSLVVRVYYDRNEYTVAFNTNGHGTAPTIQSVRYQGFATEPTAPTATGYIFEGWYKDQAATQAYDFTTDTVTENITLYGKWSKDDAKNNTPDTNDDDNGDDNTKKRNEDANNDDSGSYVARLGDNGTMAIILAVMIVSALAASVLFVKRRHNW